MIIDGGRCARWGGGGGSAGTGTGPGPGGMGGGGGGKGSPAGVCGRVVTVRGYSRWVVGWGSGRSQSGPRSGFEKRE
jgi:hypothetical protein